MFGFGVIFDGGFGAAVLDPFFGSFPGSFFGGVDGRDAMLLAFPYTEPSFAWLVNCERVRLRFR